MRCSDVAVNLPDFVLGKVEANLQKCIGVHLEICARCKSEYEGVRASVAVLEQVAQEDYPDSFWQELRAVVMERVSSPKRARWSVPVFAGGLAVVLLMAGIGIYEFTVTRLTTTGEQIQTVSALTSGAAVG